mmetsp:Transcript_8060/g.18858  ORF Transcript_8060/g.18858 Transcript_8060/m.18858 type:complete len:271 (+) Transcript_8060:948-1760(+)
MNSLAAKPLLQMFQSLQTAWKDNPSCGALLRGRGAAKPKDWAASVAGPRWTIVLSHMAVIQRTGLLQRGQAVVNISESAAPSLPPRTTVRPELRTGKQDGALTRRSGAAPARRLVVATRCMIAILLKPIGAPITAIIAAPHTGRVVTILRSRSPSSTVARAGLIRWIPGLVTRRSSAARTMPAAARILPNPVQTLLITRIIRLRGTIARMAFRTGRPNGMMPRQLGVVRTKIWDAPITGTLIVMPALQRHGRAKRRITVACTRRRAVFLT